MREVDAAEDADNGGVEEEGERRVGEGEVAVRKLVERDAEAGVEEVAEVPEDGDAGVLPEGEGGGKEEERGGSEGRGRAVRWAGGLDRAQDAIASALGEEKDGSRAIHRTAGKEVLVPGRELFLIAVLAATISLNIPA